jgi:hypothetical protein
MCVDLTAVYLPPFMSGKKKVRGQFKPAGVRLGGFGSICMWKPCSVGPMDTLLFLSEELRKDILHTCICCGPDKVKDAPESEIGMSYLRMCQLGS